MIAIGALSPYLKPALTIRVYPPCLFSYLLDNVFFTLFADCEFCNFETNNLVVCNESFLPNVIILSA